jgi:hypothetical protein
MVDFAQADFSTTPSPLTITVAPTVSGSNTIQIQLQPIPSFTINYSPSGSGWQKFNADVLKNAATTIITAITPFVADVAQTQAQKYLNNNATFTVPSIPLSYSNVSITLTPSNLGISTTDQGHVLITATVTIT